MHGLLFVYFEELNLILELLLCYCGYSDGYSAGNCTREE